MPLPLKTDDNNISGLYEMADADQMDMDTPRGKESNNGPSSGVSLNPEASRLFRDLLVGSTSKILVVDHSLVLVPDLFSYFYEYGNRSENDNSSASATAGFKILKNRAWN